MGFNVGPFKAGRFVLFAAEIRACGGVVRGVEGGVPSHKSK